MLARRKYAVRVERCFWVPPDRRVDKKITTGGLLCARLWRVDCVTRRVCDELTGNPFSHRTASAVNKPLEMFSCYLNVIHILFVSGFFQLIICMQAISGDLCYF